MALDAAAFCKAYWLAEWAQLEEVSAGVVGGAAAGWAGVWWRGYDEGKATAVGW